MKIGIVISIEKELKSFLESNILGNLAGMRFNYNKRKNV